MSLFRAAARTMLASYFVINGVKALKNPHELAADAEPVANTLVPALKKLAPAEISARIPEDTVSLVRISGAMQTFGGIALATGVGRRLGALALASSLIPQTLAKHPFWTRSDRDERATDRAAFVKNVALLGGVLIAAGDTQGKPGLAWRAQVGRKRLGRDASSVVDQAGAKVKRRSRKLRKQAKHAARDAQRAARSAVKDVQSTLS